MPPASRFRGMTFRLPNLPVSARPPFWRRATGEARLIGACSDGVLRHSSVVGEGAEFGDACCGPWQFVGRGYVADRVDGGRVDPPGHLWGQAVGLVVGVVEPL